MLWWTLLKLRWGPARARLNAVLELGQTRNRGAVGSLIDALQRNPDIRSEIATALGTIRDPRAADALLTLLLDKHAPTRSAAVWALGEIGDRRAADPLAAVLSNDGASDVCDAAALALVRLRDARGIVRGVPLLVLSVRRGARGRMPNFEGIGEMLQQIAVPGVRPLIELLQHDDQDVLALAAGTLAQLGDANAVEPLIGMLQRGSDAGRGAAAEALARIGGARATEALVLALGDKDPEVRQTSSSLLTRSGPRAVEPLVAALSTDDTLLRQEAAKVLGTLRDDRAVEPLIAAINDPGDEVRWAAANALIAIGDRRAIEPLVLLLMGGGIVPPGYLFPLLGFLRRSAHAIPVELLQQLTRLEYVIGPPIQSGTGAMPFNALDNRLDCSEYRQLARRELVRRGIQVEP